jgi:two-component system NtrC family sensor kinase
VAERTQELEDAGRDLEGKNRELSRTIRELKDTRDRMVQQGKMATLGEMAAGATHEINNPLNFMRAGAFAIRKKCTVLQGLLEAHEMPSEHGDRLSEIVELSDVVANGCQRIQGITEGLMRASQQRGGRAETLDLNDVARETVQLVQGSKPSGINLRCEVAPLPSVWGNRSQLNQVLLNLVLNAFDAVENKGTVTVRTRSAGESVEMEVQDDGPGIAPEHLKRVFEPFFTTKELNRGRGLGLSICMQIVQQHDGSMCVRSEPGKGALFTVSLPTLRSLGPRPDGSKINGTAHDSHR